MARYPAVDQLVYDSVNLCPAKVIESGDVCRVKTEAGERMVPYYRLFDLLGLRDEAVLEAERFVRDYQIAERL